MTLWKDRDFTKKSLTRFLTKVVNFNKLVEVVMKVAFKHSKDAVVVVESIKEILARILSTEYIVVDSTVREELWTWLETKYTERCNQLEETKTFEELHSDRLLNELALAWGLV
jgi:ribosomal protein L31E